MRSYLDFPAFAALKEPGMFMREGVEHGAIEDAGSCWRTKEKRPPEFPAAFEA